VLKYKGTKKGPGAAPVQHKGTKKGAYASGPYKSKSSIKA